MTTAPAVEVHGLRKVYPSRTRGEETVAVSDAAFTVARGGSLGIVGESGSGKTTIARMLAGLEHPTAGRISVAGADRSDPSHRRADRRRRARELQLVFQDPYTSLDPRQRVGDCIEEVLRLHTDDDREQRATRVAQLLDEVGLDARAGRARPRDLSGGQRQRVAIARALAARPQVLLLDEAVSALDVSIQAQILNLLADIREQTGTTYVFISHDLGVVRQVCDDVIVLRRGEIVEQGPTERVLEQPQHPYTQLLRASVPRPGWRPRRRGLATGATSDAAAAPVGGR